MLKAVGRVNQHLTAAGWTRFTRFTACFIVGFMASITVIAVHGNPSSQLSVGCYSAWVVLIAAALVTLFDRRR